MTARRVAYSTGFAVLVASGGYVFVYLYRWEWNRALFAMAMFIAAEVALVGAVVLERVARLNRRLDQGVDEQILERVREAAPPGAQHFDWLDPGEPRAGVFVPILMAAGIVASALAWLVERVARATGGRALERALARRLSALAWPSGGLVPVEDAAVALLRGPGALER